MKPNRARSISRLFVKSDRSKNLEDLARVTHELIDFMGENSGETADWPMHISFDNTEYLRRFLWLINRVVDHLKLVGFDKVYSK